MKRIRMFADLLCPFAYIVHHHWRQLRAEFQNSIEVQHCSLSLEYINREPTNKRDLDVELPVLMVNHHEVRWTPWSAPESHWPVTALPGFEAVKCAELQGMQFAEELAWNIRVAFFGASRCVSLRHELIDLAAAEDLDMAKFTDDFDNGVAKAQVIAESREGWETLSAPGSPTWVLPTGDQIADFGIPEIEVDQTGRPRLVTPASCVGPECIDFMRTILQRIVSTEK